VRDSIGSAACACAIARSASTIASSAGSSTPIARARQHQRVRRVVDVFRRAGEVDELARALELASPATRSFRKYSTALTSWLVTASIAFTRAASAAPKPSRSPQPLARVAREARQLGQPELGQREQPLDLDPDPVAQERRFGQQRAQRGDASRVTAVERGQRVELESGRNGRGIGEIAHGAPMLAPGRLCYIFVPPPTPRAA
jgi:hypothetical protein